ncbi:MAG: T9SS type A sorting domain-containing protein [Candidatus Cloacimonetes bacterium]|nr:T9SS type A sorting domain-containing protein [Candidatus Cloacimonadota bacterium]
MKPCKMLFILMLFTPLFSQFNQPVQVNENMSVVYYRGSRACKIVGDEVFMTFVDADSNDVYFAHSPDGEDFTCTLVDEDICHYFDLRNNTQPCLEVLPTGEIVIFYLKENYTTTFYKAISDDGGQTFVCDSLLSDISGFSSTTVDDKIYLCYQQGSSVALSNFQHFTDTEESENADGGSTAAIVKFWGPDILYGPVHSNDDIWIQNAGGGINQGWPTFYGFVSTAGIFRNFNEGGYPLSQALKDLIFLGGWAEGVPPYSFDPSADLIMQNGIPLGDPETDIVYVKLDGSGFSSMYGDIVETGVEEFDVYSWYPHDEATTNAIINYGGNWYEDANIVWTNYITMYDTIWTVGPSFSVNNQAVWVEDAQLWIEGIVEGMQTWGCSDMIYIVGDITYTNTIPGDPPDDPDNPNLTDYFGLVSEKRIYIKYKHHDPFNNMEIRDDNCSDVMLYGAYAAIGKGDTLIYGDLACHYDGIFSFEYQHPHGSTPDFYAPSPYYPYNDTLCDYIDFHKFIFPENPNVPPNIEGFNLHGNSPQVNGTCGFPYEDPGYLNSYPNNNPADYIYPYGTDYPWYNPVWPESSDDIVNERGTITTFGSIAQRRRGYVHRSGGDPYNHHPSNEWDLENFHYDGTHPSTGYSKDYYYDSRFLETTPTDYPVSNPNSEEPKIVITVSEDAGATFIQQQEWLLENLMAQHLPIASQDDIVAVAYQQLLNFINLHYSIDNGNIFTSYIIYDLLAQSLQDLQIYDDEIYIFAKGSMIEYVYKFDPYSSNLITLFEFDSNYYLSDFAIGNEGGKVYVAIEEPFTYPCSFMFQYTSDDPYVLSEEYIWQTPFDIWNPPRSVVAINFNEQDSVFVSFLNAVNSNHNYGDLYLAKGSLPELVETEENEIVKPGYSLNIYPNPFNPTTTIKFTTEDTEKNTELIIYNIKGQKVKTLFPSLCHPELVEGRGINNQYSIIWNGTDDSGKMVGSGIYFCRLKVNNKSKVVKKMVLVK